MNQITLRLSDEQLDTVERAADARGVSRSEHVRDVLEEYHDATLVDVDTVQAVARELREREQALADCRRDRERLRNQQRKLIDDREEKAELVEYVEQEKSLQERREERATAPAWRRFKWWLVGAPSADDEEEGEA